MHFAVVLDLLIASRLDFRPILQGEDVGGVLQVVLFDQNTLEGFRIEAECRTALETLVIGVHVDILEILVLVIGGHIRGLRYRRVDPQLRRGLNVHMFLGADVIGGDDDRVSLDTTFREYYVSRVAATESTGSEDISRVDTALTIRVYNLHGITLRYSEASRNGRYATLPTSHQTVGTFSIGYTLLGSARFGAVDWRPGAQEK